MMNQSAIWRLRVAVVSAFLSGALPAVAATAAQVVLEEVVVKGQLLRQATSAFTTNLMTADEIRTATVHQSQEVLRRVPGLEIRNFGLGGVADGISLRGFSSGSHGGDLGFLVDGIPLNEAVSHADGYADLNVLIPLELDNVTVYKGPATALYGNYNRGGTIFIETRKGGDYRYLDSSGGSDSTFDLQSAVGMELGGGPLNLAAQLYRTDGFRPQSTFEKGTFAGRYSFDLGRSQLALSGRGHRGQWDSASYAPASIFFSDNPHAMDPRVQNDGGEKDFYTARTDLAQTLTDQLQLLGFVYATEQKFTRYFTRPINAAIWRQREEAYDRGVQGAGINLNGVAWADRSLTYVVGIETYREVTAYDLYDGLDNRRRVSASIYDRTFDFRSQAAFFEGQWAIDEKFRPTLGVRFDRFTGDCHSDGTESGPDPCNRAMNDYDRLSPKLGVRSRLFGSVDLRASYSTGFQLPNPRGLFSVGAADVDLNVFEQLEGGITWQVHDSLTFDLSAFRLDSRDEIREFPAGTGIFVNFGDTRREGIELAATWKPTRHWLASLAAGAVDTEIRNNPDPNLIGKELTAVPKSTATLTVSYQPERGFGARFTARDVGRYPVNPANTITYGGYSLLDVGATYRGEVFGSALRAYLNVNNALDKRYATATFIIGGMQLFAPAPPRQILLGAQVDF